MYALFHHDKQISKAHFIKLVVVIEAFERKVFYRSRYGIFKPEEYEIKELHIC